MRIRKEFLKNARFGDHPNAWILQAKGFRYAAEGQLQSSKTKNKLISTEEAFSLRFSYKTACYLLAHSIELALKALYKLTQKTEDPSAEKFSHGLIKLEGELVKKGVLKTNEIDKHTLEVAYILLAWFGRYHKPLESKLDTVIDNLFVESETDPVMVENKYSIDFTTYAKLAAIADCLLNKVRLNEGSMDRLLFDPFL